MINFVRAWRKTAHQYNDGSDYNIGIVSVCISCVGIGEYQLRSVSEGSVPCAYTGKDSLSHI